MTRHAASDGTPDRGKTGAAATHAGGDGSGSGGGGSHKSVPRLSALARCTHRQPGAQVPGPWGGSAEHAIRASVKKKQRR